MIDTDLIKHLDDADKQRMGTLERFFEHDGWTLFVEYLEDQFNLSQDLVNNAPNWDTYVQARTRMKLCNDLGQLPETTRQEFEQIALENQAQSMITDDDDEFAYE